MWFRRPLAFGTRVQLARGQFAAPKAFCWVAVGFLVTLSLAAEERLEHFDRDPHWEGRNHRAVTPPPQRVQQDFGFSLTNHAGGKPGEIGGFFTPAAEPAYYAKMIAEADFEQPLKASGKLACTGRQFHVLVGFFNADTVNEWRTPNSIFLRLYGRGDVFYAYVEYATSRWRAGGDSPGGFATIDDPSTGRSQLRGFASDGAVHAWSLTYDPNGNNGNGSITATIDDEVAVCHLDEGHKQDGARFNRCGLLNIPKSYDDGGEVWFDDLVINGQRESFDRDPGWDARGNRAVYQTTGVRPRFDFGFSPSHFAGGEQPGELGGIVYRGDCRDPSRLACYADRLDTLSLDKPLRMSGRVCLQRGVSDSTTLLGFFHSEDSVTVSSSQASGFPMNFLGLAVEGPSREGFLFYPVYRFPGEAAAYATGPTVPHILPNGEPHDWSLRFDPSLDNGTGAIVVRFDGQETRLSLRASDRLAPARFNRFGIVTTWIDGNAQHIYFDDLEYTFRQ